MKRNMMGKNLRQTIWRSLGRYLAIVAIIALGCGIFVGLRITKTDMIATGQHYTDQQNMFDLRLLNSYGWTSEDVAAVAKMDGIVHAEGSITLDVYARQGENTDDGIYRLYSIPESINKVHLLAGRMPQSPDECLVDGSQVTDKILGTKVTVSATNESDTLDSLNYHSYTVVGYVSSPLYMDMVRGSTTLGSGSLTSYIYIPQAAFNVDYYTEINVTIPGDWAIYSDAYADALEAMADTLKVAITPLANDRFADVKAEAEKLYAEGLQEYEDGKAEYEKAKAEVLQELADGLKKLQEGQAEIDKNLQALADGEKQLLDGQKLLDENRDKLAAGRLELEKTRAEVYAQLAAADKELRENEKAVNDGLAQIEEGLPQIDDGLAQIEEGLPQLELAITLAQLQVDATQGQLDLAKLFGNAERIAQLEEELSQQTAQLEEYQTQRAEAVKMQQELTARKQELLQTRQTLEQAKIDIANGYKELESGRLQAESEFAAAQAELTAGELELEKGQKELDAKRQEWLEGKTALEEAQKELTEGWAEYESGKAEAEAELSKAEQELLDGEKELEEARKTIADMDIPDVYALTRNTNVGYLALDSNSDIVSGVAVVLPVFFLLIAALVCITTMTRMVEEERTQIGTLKALGYSSAQIVSKYIFYSASAALIGCALGVAVGCTFFPRLLWNAYGIIFNITPDVVLTVDWALSLGVTATYIVVSSFVTWYCCYRTLREVPAELIRPKAPAIGKKILLEKLPVWNRLSFLNKVMIRNVLRYRQRLLMMLVGIGGCTALLLTGFGMRDTIVDIANIQYSEVSLFDMEIYFSKGQTQQEQEAFREALGQTAENVGFFYQTSVETEYDGRVREVNMVVMDDSIKTFLDMHRAGKQLDMPKPGEAFISVGAAELLGISIGDEVTVRDADMKSLTLTIGGIYENHVQNYLIVVPETVEAQWGYQPMCQMAYVNVREGHDVEQAGTLISAMEGVVNISTSQDNAEMFNSMMTALEMVIVVIVFSAGLLAAIVLYNLTNININERVREIATIKVLGFNAKETSAYVFKENILLTVVGALGGLLLGRVFLEFVMSKIKIDIVWFSTRLSVPSYIFSVLLTLLCAAIVDFIFHKKLDKINMAEALKSVE